MPAIIIPRRHFAQPQGRVVLDDRNPLSSGALTVYNGGSNVDVVRGLAGIKKGVLVDFPIEQGLSAASLNKDGWVQLPALPAILTQQITMFWVGKLGEFGRADNLLEGGGLFVQELGYPAPGIMWGNRSNVRAFYYIDAWQNYVAGPEMAAGEYVVLVAVRSETHIRLYKNGALGTTTAQAARNYSGARPYYINSALDNAGWAGNSQTLMCGLMLNAWSDAQVRGFSENPYQIFRADPIRIYSLPSGPISVTINSITASNITSSGARITLGLTR